MLGMGFFVLGLMQRSGKEASCAECGYMRTPEGAMPDKCPECGAVWSESGGIVSGKYKRNVPMMLVGVLCVMLGVSTVFMQMRIAGFLSRLQPTRWLINDISAGSGGMAWFQWPELQSRTLSEEETVQLAEQLLVQQRKKGYMASAAQAWITKQLTGNILPDDLRNKWFSSMFDIELVAPKTMRVGSKFRVEIDAVNQRTLDSTGMAGLHHRLLIDGFYVGDAHDPIGRLSHTMYPSLMANDSKYKQFAEVDAEVVGKLPIRFVIWSVVAPRPGHKWQIHWNEDGDPQLPPGTIWSERMEVEATVDVLP